MILKISNLILISLCTIIKNQFGLKVIIIYLEHQAYILDFNKRVKKQSVKNFQLIDENDSIILQFGKSTESSYVMDFTYPLSPLQAFAICITSIDRKFGCQ
jgi:tubby-related protein 1